MGFGRWDIFTETMAAVVPALFRAIARGQKRK
jgi:hypothetical protein